MKRETRQGEILTLLDKKAGISAGDLAQYFNVSRMTIHRDLHALLEQGMLLRIHGGAVKRNPVSPATGVTHCFACNRQILPHQRSEIHKADGLREETCCTSCGLRQFSAETGVVRFVVADLLSGKMLLAEEAYFLVNSLATPCCQPSLLSFASQDEVASFQAGFGGSIARLDEAVEFFRVAEGLTGAP